MNRVEELIQQLCPNGVEWKKLGEIGTFYSGLSGKTKKDFEKGNAKYVTYSNIFNNVAVNLKIDDVVNVLPNEKQNIIAYGDIIFTGSSETPDECGMSSVVTEIINEPIYLNSFCFGFRLNNLSLFEPSFAKFLFRSNHLRNSIKKTANGVTRYNISKQLFSQIEIPIPPLPIQQEIVRILDTFTELTANLQTELDARKKQYAYYRDCLLNFEGVDGVEWKKLGEVTIYAKQKIEYSKLTKNNYVGVENLLQNAKGKIDATSLPTSGNATKFTPDNILIGNIRPYLKKIWLADREGGASGDVLVLSIIDKNCSYKYLYYVLSSDIFFDYDNKYAKGGKMPRGDKQMILNFPIPIPPLSEQRRIVAILDQFETLVNDQTVGLPAELEARRKQYEYYRDKLLTFDRV